MLALNTKRQPTQNNSEAVTVNANIVFKASRNQDQSPEIQLIRSLVILDQRLLRLHIVKAEA